MSDENKEVLAALLAELKDVQDHNKAETLYCLRAQDGHLGGPYNWQVEFHNKGSEFPERAIIAANQTGKTQSAAAEVNYHLTGRYPPWWRGKRWDHPTSGIVSGQTNEDIRDIQQLALFGNINEEKEPEGNGWVPRDAIVDFSYRHCGINNVLDTVSVKHVSGGNSTCSLKSYEQKAAKFQGRTIDWGWLDEEPDDYGIFTEMETRTLVREGILMFTITPLKGMSEIVSHFLDGIPGTWYVTATWADAPHISPSQAEQMASRYPVHERDTRSKGIPMMGTGLVYNIPDEMICCEPFHHGIPTGFKRICGVDFGIDHPGAAAWLAYDADVDIIYLYDCYKEAGQTPAYHAQAIMSRGKWIPVSWPHDGMARDKGSGVPLMAQYRARGVNMLGEPASWDSEFQRRTGMRGQSREAGSIDLLERMHTGRFKVIRTPATELFLAEKRMLHRKDAQIVPIKDDIESAVRYALMMLRCALSDAEHDMVLPTRQPDDYDPLASFHVDRSLPNVIRFSDSSATSHYPTSYPSA